MSREDTLAHLLRVARFARTEGYGVLSSGEKIGAALALDRADWLKELDYTLGEAIGRLEGDWLACIPEAARILRDEAEYREEELSAVLTRRREAIEPVLTYLQDK